MNINLKTDITWRDFLIRAGLIIGTVAIIVWSMPRDTRNHFKIEKGKPWNYADLKAPFDFPIYKSEEAVKAERDSLLKEYEPYFNYLTRRYASLSRTTTRASPACLPTTSAS